MEQLQTQIVTKHFQFFWSKVTDATETTSFFLSFLLSKSKIKPFRGLFAASLELRQIVGF